MLLKTNPKQVESDIPVEDIEAWLAKHPERTAEHLTGKLAPDSVISKARKSTTGVVSPKAKTGTVKARTGTVKTKGPTAQYNKDLTIFRDTLREGGIVFAKDFDKRSKQSVFKMVSDLRKEGFDIITLSRVNTAVGWTLSAALSPKLKLKGE